MDIKRVIQRHGFQLQEVSAKMEVKHSTLSGMLSGNPTIGTLRKIVDAINAMNEEKKLDDRCYLAEFFADELPAGFTLTSSGTEEAPKTEASEPQTATAQADALPLTDGRAASRSAMPDASIGNGSRSTGAFNNEPAQQPDLTADIAFICPHCHEAIKLGFVK